MSIKKVSGFVGVVALMFGGLAIGQTQVPNTFSSGQPARAAEVNANFSELESAANQNALDIQAIPAGPAIFVKSNGQNVGMFLSAVFGTCTGGCSRPIFDANWWWILSDTGYLFAINPADRTESGGNSIAGDHYIFNGILFDGANCSGQAHAYVHGEIRQAQATQGMVAASEDRNDPILYYTPKGSTAFNGWQAVSVRTSTGCEPLGVDTTSNFVVLAFSNDPFITGVPDQRVLNTPITLGY